MGAVHRLKAVREGVVLVDRVRGGATGWEGNRLWGVACGPLDGEGTGVMGLSGIEEGFKREGEGSQDWGCGPALTSK